MMPPKINKLKSASKKFVTTVEGTNDPSTTASPSAQALPTSQPTTSKEPANFVPTITADKEIPRKRFIKYVYDKDTKTCLGRTCKSWLLIISYSFVYLIFLCTYTLIFLFASLSVIKYTTDYSSIDKIELFTYSEHGVGISATPTAEHSFPLISYQLGSRKSYQKYIYVIDKLLSNRNGSVADLGSCSKPPYGYDTQPCIFLRINHQINWSGNPLLSNSSVAEKAPKEVKEWLRSSKKLWFHCDGYHSHDKEHIGRIKYYPHPPGIDPNLFPLKVQDRSPLIGVQISDFTQGVSLVVQCNLWYDHGPSTLKFILYIEPLESGLVKD